MTKGYIAGIREDPFTGYASTTGYRSSTGYNPIIADALNPELWVRPFVVGPGVGVTGTNVEFDVSPNLGSYVRQSHSLEGGQVFTVTFEVYDYVTGGVRLLAQDSNQVLIPTISANGIYTLSTTAVASDSPGFLLDAADVTTLKVRGISVR